jgi:hypothetical protein
MKFRYIKQAKTFEETEWGILRSAQLKGLCVARLVLRICASDIQDLRSSNTKFAACLLFQVTF